MMKINSLKFISLTKEIRFRFIGLNKFSGINLKVISLKKYFKTKLPSNYFKTEYFGNHQWHFKQYSRVKICANSDVLANNIVEFTNPDFIDSHFSSDLFMLKKDLKDSIFKKQYILCLKNVIT